jgi:hypothetical protein
MDHKALSDLVLAPIESVNSFVKYLLNNYYVSGTVPVSGPYIRKGDYILMGIYSCKTYTPINSMPFGEE